MNLQDAITLATDNGMVVTDYYAVRRKGYKVGAFKVGFRHGKMIEIRLTKPGARVWTMCAKGLTVFYGKQGECIAHAVKELTK